MLVLLVSAGRAEATSIAGGTAILKLDRGVKRQLGEAGVGFSGLDPAGVRGRVATMPIDGGQMEGPPAKGVAIPLGGIGFSSSGKVAKLTKIGLDITHGELGAEIAGGRLVVARFHGVAVVRDGFDAELTMRSLRLTRAGAVTLNRELEEPGLFRAGRRLAGLRLDLQLRTIKAHAGTISLDLAPTFRAKLESREAEISPFVPMASASAIPPTFGLPISYGAIAPGLEKGSVGSTAGLRITQGGGPVFFRDLFLVPVEIDLDAKTVNSWVSLVSSNKSREKAAIATVDFAESTVTADRSAGTVTASVVPARLTSSAAALFDEAFAQGPSGQPPLFEAGESLGMVGFTLHG